MLNINFVNPTITEENVLKLATTVKFEELDMLLSLNNDNIKSLQTKIENKQSKYTDEEIEVFKSQVETLELENIEIAEKVEEVRPVYDEVVSVIASAGKDEFCNGEENVRNILRVVACAENSKLFKYALLSAIDNDDLFSAMEVCHDIDNNNEFGNSSQTKELKESYKQAESQIQNILKTTLSLPFESEYTSSLRVKFNGTDLKLLHECYVTGFSNKFESKDESKSTQFVGREVKKLITSKTNSKGEVTRNFKKFAETVCKLAIAKISA